ncbi:MAG: hypothetical protein V3R27_01615, partial [Pseudomonadales bacterium]
ARYAAPDHGSREALLALQAIGLQFGDHRVGYILRKSLAHELTLKFDPAVFTLTQQPDGTIERLSISGILLGSHQVIVVAFGHVQSRTIVSLERVPE